MLPNVTLLNSLFTPFAFYIILPINSDYFLKKHWLLPKFWRTLFFLWYTLCYMQRRWNPVFRALNYFSENVEVIKVTLEEAIEFQRGNWNWSSNRMRHISYWFMLMTLNCWGMKTSVFQGYGSQNNYFHADFVTHVFMFISLNN